MSAARSAAIEIRPYSEPGAVYWLDDGTPFTDAGEVLDVGDPRLESAGPRPIVPRVETREEAEEALSTRADIEARIAEMEVRRDQFVANLNRQIGNERRRLKWWDFRFRDDVIAVARSLLRKGKSVQFDHARVAFRFNKGRREITEMTAAVAYCRDWLPEVVKVVESVNLTGLDAALAAEAEATGEPRESLPFVRVEGSGETVAIETGIGGGR